MNAKFNDHLKMLNVVGLEDAAGIFGKCFQSIHITSPTFNQLDDWVNNVKIPTITNSWVWQKEMKYPGFILYFAMLYYRDEILRQNLHQRQSSVEKAINSPESDYLKNIEILINQDLDQLSPFDGVRFLGELMGAWMLTCPREMILSDKDKIIKTKIREREILYRNEILKGKSEKRARELVDYDGALDVSPNQVWIRHIYHNTLTIGISNDELELLFVADYYLHYAFVDFESYNVLKS
jgi:hypothetical protein